MTISVARTNDCGSCGAAARLRRGFTLIEIVVVLAIAAVVMGGAAALMTSSSDERALNDASGELERLAKRARVVSLLQQTPYAIEFLPHQIILRPLAEATGSLSRIGGLEVLEDSADFSEGMATRAPVRQQIDLPEDMEMRIRRWGAVNEMVLSEKSPQIWRFDPDGLCEPITVHYISGNSYRLDTYHPLTASIADSETETN